MHSAGPGQTLSDPPQTGAAARSRWRRLQPEYLLVLALGLLVLAVHDVGYLLGLPYWNDEAWVAVGTRLPLGDLMATTSSTPIGFSFLARLTTIGQSQSARLLPLAFAGVAVMVAYWLARRLDWPNRPIAYVAGVLAAAAALLVPAMLVQDDLKQYTADACMALVIFALVARLERTWSRLALVALSVSIWGGMLLSSPALFVGAASLGAVCLIQLLRRDWRHLTEAIIASAGTGVLCLVIYKIFDAKAVVSGLVAHWSPWFLPYRHGPRADWNFVVTQFDQIHAYFGLGPAWLAVPLFAAGVVTIARLGRPATAVAVVALWPEMIALSALHKYPFLDLRTSTFLITVTAVIAAIGVAGLCAWLRSALRGGRTATAVAATVAVLAVAGCGLAAKPYVRSHVIPDEDIRQQTLAVAKLAGPRVPIVVSGNSNWGFAYYWPIGEPSRRPDPANRQDFQAYFPAQGRIVVATDRDVAAIEVAVTHALAELPAGSCGRIWLVRTHVIPSEKAAWATVLGQLRLTPTVLPDGLAYVVGGPRACR